MTLFTKENTVHVILQRARAALLSGTIAIVLNVAALWSADLVHQQTAHGGILRLIVQLTGLTAPHSPAFAIAFHVAVGLAMAVVYGLLLEPLWCGRSLVLGLAYAAAVWLVNAFVVLPLLGEGVAGSGMLSLTGMIWFAAAHTVFFVALSLFYPRMSNLIRR